MAEIFQDTLCLIKQIPQEPSIRYRGLLTEVPAARMPNTIVKIEITNEDCLDACSRIIKSNPNSRVGLLNMASEICPGGGVRKGSRAQEEDICRRTTLYPTIKKQSYPLAFDEVLFTPNVKIVKSSNYLKYMNHVNISGVVTAAAIRRPLVNDQYLELLRNKITMMLETFEYHGMDHLVLGAWGCGAFHNPPDRVAEAFKEILSSDRFRNRFKNITFAILQPPGCHKQNYDIFLDMFMNF